MGQQQANQITSDIAGIQEALESVSSPLARLPLHSMIASLEGALSFDGPSAIAADGYVCEDAIDWF